MKGYALGLLIFALVFTAMALGCRTWIECRESHSFLYCYETLNR